MTAPTVGRIVHYQLSAQDVEVIDQEHPFTTSRPAHRNPVRAGMTYAAVVVAVPGGGHANLKVLLDGYGDYWATSRAEGTQPGTWRWPPRS